MFDIREWVEDRKWLEPAAPEDISAVEACGWSQKLKTEDEREACRNEVIRPPSVKTSFLAGFGFLYLECSGCRS